MLWMDREWYSVSEVAEILGVSKQTVREMLITKKLPGTKAGREWRILKKDVQSFLGISENANEKDLYIKELEAKVKYLTLQNEAFKNIANSLIKVIG